MAIYYIYWAYYRCPLFVWPSFNHIVREHMDSDMRDEELVFYTGHGERKGGFFVAEVDGKPVGTVAYQKKVRLLHSPKKGYRSKLPEVK